MNPVKFNFTVSAEDAQNIIEALQEAKISALSQKVEFQLEGKIAEADWCQRHAEYWEKLIQVVCDGSSPVDSE